MTHPLYLFQYCPKCGSPRFEEHDFKAKKCTDCKFIYYFNSSAATAAFIVDEKDRLLVARRANNPAKGTLDLPGGFVDLFETAEETIRREIKEETGMDLTGFKYLFSLPNTYEYSGFEVHTLDMFFEVKVKNDTRLLPADDVSELFFLEKEAIKPSDFGLDSIRKAIEIYIS